MTAFRTIGAFTRRLSVLFAIFLLLSFFLFLYYFRYVPANRERLQHQGFLMLQQQQDGIQQRLDDLKNFFTFQNRRFAKKGLTGKDTSFKVESPFTYSANIVKKQKRADQTLHISKTDPLISWDLDGQNVVSFEFNKQINTARYTVSLRELFEQILESGKVDFFRFHFIICKQHAENVVPPAAEKEDHDHQKDSTKPSHILYHSSGLPASEQLEPDSLGNLIRSAQFSKIIDLEINGNWYKVFLLPFQLEHNTLILAGLMPESVYENRLQDIPFGTISCLAIIFILILIALPYIKVFFIGREEQWGIRDIAFLGTTLFIGTSLLLVILQQLLMQTGDRLRTKDNLYELSEGIDTKFHEEISAACFELKSLDACLKAEVDAGIDTTLAKAIDSSEIIVRKKGAKGGYRLQLPSPGAYLNYDRIHWFDDSGQQVYKGAFDSLYTFVKIDRRPYFKEIKAKRLYSFTNIGDAKHYGAADSFTIQPLYGMSSGTFEVALTVPSHVDSMLAAGMSTYMNSVMNAIVPQGYGFYIIDGKGFIQFQSDGIVTLKENFLEWINDDQNLANVIKNRQSKYVLNRYINGKQYSLYIRPLDQLPLYLVAYHCNDDSIASMLHVNVFILFFLCILFFMLLLYCLIAFGQGNHFSRLNQPIVQHDNIGQYGKNKKAFLFAANRYLFFYVLVTVAYKIFAHQYAAIWMMGLVFPVFAVWTVALCFKSYIREENHFPFANPVKNATGFLKQSCNYAPLILLFLLNFIFFRVEANSSSWFALIGYEIISLLLMPVAFIKPLFGAGLLKRLIFFKDDHLYNAFWFLLVVAISIVPVNCFFVYAQEKEIALQTKAYQLDMAESIERRLSTFDWTESVAKRRNIPDSVFFKQGVYIDTCITTNTARLSDSVKICAEPYERIIRSLSWRNHSFDKMFPGQDSAKDGQWFRPGPSNGNSRLMTLAYNLRSETKRPDNLRNVQSLRMSCKLPSMFQYYQMDNDKTKFLIISFSLLLLILFYQLLRTVARRLFQTWNLKNQDYNNSNNHSFIRERLNKESYNGLPGDYERIKEIFKKYRDKKDTKLACLARAWEKEYNDDYSGEAGLTEQEGLILFHQYHLSPLYEKLWNGCIAEEKYLLFDMSKDGLINYKKVDLIQQLLYKGLLINNSEQLKIMSVSFRNYILDKRYSEELKNLKEQFQMQGSWGKLRTPVLIIITAIGVFLFLTQQDLLQRMTALIPTLSAVFGLGTLILGSKSSATAKK